MDLLVTLDRIEINTDRTNGLLHALTLPCTKKKAPRSPKGPFGLQIQNQASLVRVVDRSNTRYDANVIKVQTQTANSRSLHESIRMRQDVDVHIQATIRSRAWMLKDVV